MYGKKYTQENLIEIQDIYLGTSVRKKYTQENLIEIQDIYLELFIFINHKK